METHRLAPLVGIAAAILTVGVLLAPYLLVSPASAWAYYDAGAITPMITGLFAVLSILIFAAGRQDRTDPAMAAGATLVMGTFALLAATLWALTVPAGTVGELGTAEIMLYHRGVLVLSTLAVPAAAVWYARSMAIL